MPLPLFPGRLVCLVSLFPFALLLHPGSGHGLSVAPMTPAAVAAASADVVIATVIGIQSEARPGGGLVEHLSLVVQERWKGDPVPFMVRTQVQTVADRTNPGAARAIAGNPTLQVGRTYLLFLREASRQPRMPLTTAGELGLYEARRTATGWAFATLEGLPVRDVDAQRVWMDVSADPADVRQVVTTPPKAGGAGTVVTTTPGTGAWSPQPTATLVRRWEALVRASGG